MFGENSIDNAYLSKGKEKTQKVRLETYFVTFPINKKNWLAG
jgi:hypothetical protein